MRNVGQQLPQGSHGAFPFIPPAQGLRKLQSWRCIPGTTASSLCVCRGGVGALPHSELLVLGTPLLCCLLRPRAHLELLSPAEQRCVLARGVLSAPSLLPVPPVVQLCRCCVGAAVLSSVSAACHVPPSAQWKQTGSWLSCWCFWRGKQGCLASQISSSSSQSSASSIFSFQLRSSKPQPLLCSWPWQAGSCCW